MNFTYQNLQTKIINILLMKYLVNTSSFFLKFSSSFLHAPFSEKYTNHQRALEKLTVFLGQAIALPVLFKQVCFSKLHFKTRTSYWTRDMSIGQQCILVLYSTKAEDSKKSNIHRESLNKITLKIEEVMQM